MTEINLSNYRVEELDNETAEGSLSFCVVADGTNGTFKPFKMRIVTWLSEDEARAIAASPDLIQTNPEYRAREREIHARRCAARAARAKDPAIIAAVTSRRDAAAQELLDIVGESVSCLAMLSSLAKRDNAGHVPEILALFERSRSVLNKIYNSEA